MSEKHEIEVRLLSLAHSPSYDQPYQKNQIVGFKKIKMADYKKGPLVISIKQVKGEIPVKITFVGEEEDKYPDNLYIDVTPEEAAEIRSTGQLPVSVQEKISESQHTLPPDKTAA